MSMLTDIEEEMRRTDHRPRRRYTVFAVYVAWKKQFPGPLGPRAVEISSESFAHEDRDTRESILCVSKDSFWFEAEFEYRMHTLVSKRFSIADLEAFKTEAWEAMSPLERIKVNALRKADEE